MRLRLAMVVLLTSALPAIVWAQGDNPYRLKPGAKGELCLNCHVVLEETMGQRHVHTPVKSGDCSECHNPHASSHGQLLDTGIDGLCADCHSDVIPDDAVSVHGALREGDCVSCHDPHASDNPNALIAPGNQLCFSCHDPIAAALDGARFKHAPAVDDCTSCHDPHASSSAESLLKAETGALCAECHDTSRASFVDQHMGYQVAGSRCTSCHDPHGGETSNILMAGVHEPLTNKMCNQCHFDPSSPDPLATKKQGIDLCRGCHSNVVNETLTKNRIHWPVADQTACLNCHNPHASSEQALLTDSTKVLCAKCHADTIARQESSLTAHAPVMEGKCGVCHSPHAANNVFLMESADSLQLCGTCHDWQGHSSHPIGPKVADQRNINLSVDCLSCHRNHGSPYKAFSHLDPGGELCVGCHEQVAR